jgi:hypothetical protein
MSVDEASNLAVTLMPVACVKILSTSSKALSSEVAAKTRIVLSAPGLWVWAENDRPAVVKAAKNTALNRINMRIGTHSITSSATARSESGTVRLCSLAALRLTTKSNVVGCMTGRLSAFSPLRS